MVDATDNARARAEELGVPLKEVEGTGQDGRVTQPDVEAFAKARAEGETEAKAQEAVVVVLNPDTNLGGYAFDADFEAIPGVRYALTEEKYEHYRAVKHNGLQVIVKA